MDLIFFHDACPDGWASAVVGKMKYPQAELRPLKYGAFDPEQIIAESRDKHVLMADFSLKTVDENYRLAAGARSLLVLDHHKTSVIGHDSLAVFKDDVKFVLDMSRSGAGLTWDYLFGCDSEDMATAFDPLGVGYPRPWWINYTEDQDLWAWKLPRSRDVNAFLNVQLRTIENWEFLIRNVSLETAADKGAAVQQQVDYLIRHAMNDVQKGEWDGHPVGVVNNGHVGSSEVGEAVYNAGYDIALMWREDGRGVMRFGLRSKTVDVGALAKRFPGGGGHAAASGFELSLAEGRMLLDSILRRGDYVTPRCC